MAKENSYVLIHAYTRSLACVHKHVRRTCSPVYNVMATLCNMRLLLVVILWTTDETATATSWKVTHVYWYVSYT